MALKYSDWARLVSMTAAMWSLWGAIWGIAYRKFFLDMIGAELGPAGLIPPKSSALFIAIIVDLPILQVLTILLALAILAIEWPLPFLQKTIVNRSFIIKMTMHFVLGFMSLLIYQTFDSAFVLFFCIWIYGRAHQKGEAMTGAELAKGGEGGGRGVGRDAERQV